MSRHTHRDKREIEPIPTGKLRESTHTQREMKGITRREGAHIHREKGRGNTLTEKGNGEGALRNRGRTREDRKWAHVEKQGHREHAQKETVHAERADRGGAHKERECMQRERQCTQTET